MMRSLLHGVWLIVALVSGCSTTQTNPLSSEIPADAIERVTEKGPVKLSVRIWPSVPRLSDLVSMEIEVKFTEGIEVKPPAFGQAVGDFLIRDYSRIQPASATASVRRFRYQLEPTQAGKHLIRAIAVEFIDKREGSENYDSAILIESEPIEINVTSELGDTVPSLALLEPMYPPRPLDQRFSWWWSVLALPVAAIFGLIVWRRRRMSAALAEPQRVSPAEIARAALAQLLSENLPAENRFQEFYVRLTGIVRLYIEGTTGVRAPEQTTEEFLRAMHSQQLFEVERSMRLKDFLEAADMVKYAGQEPSSEQIQLSITRAREFIEIRSTSVEEIAKGSYME